MKKAIILLISTLAFLNFTFSQEGKVKDYKVLKNNYFEYAFENLPSLKENQISKLFRYKLNLKKVDKINKLIDADIVNIVLSRNQDYKSKAILRPQSIIGTVITQTYDAKEEAFFHTEWAVRIDKIIADDRNIISNSQANTSAGKIVYIKSMSGMIGDRFRNIMHSKKLSVGEKVLLFIAPVRDLGKRRFLSEGEMLKKFNISSIDNLDKTFTITGGYTIKFHNVYSENGNCLGSLNDINKTIKQIVNINNRVQFEKDFSSE